MQFKEWLREDIYQGFMNQRNRTRTLCVDNPDSGNQYTASAGERAGLPAHASPCGAVAEGLALSLDLATTADVQEMSIIVLTPARIWYTLSYRRFNLRMRRADSAVFTSVLPEEYAVTLSSAAQREYLGSGATGLVYILLDCGRTLCGFCQSAHPHAVHIRCPRRLSGCANVFNYYFLIGSHAEVSR